MSVFIESLGISDHHEDTLYKRISDILRRLLTTLLRIYWHLTECI